MNILEAINDPQLFKPWFRDSSSWQAWLAFLRALFALPLDTADLSIYQACTARTLPSEQQAREAWLVIGRRGGKSFVCALIAVFLACFRSYAEYLTPGERGVVMVIATDRKQAKVILRYVAALIEGVVMLRGMLVARREESIELNNGIDIEVHTASFRAVRGRTVVACLADEIAFWRSEDSANPDVEIINAIRPAMATIPNALLIGLSSPYARRGLLWDQYSKHYGHDGDVLVWQADSQTMNPTLSQHVIDRAYQDDPAAASAEYGATFRSDVEGFLLPEWIDGAIAQGVHEIPPQADVHYFAFADPSGGASDSFTLAIAHREEARIVLDVCRGRKPPFSPSQVVADYAALLKRYGLHRVTGDRYSAEWVVEAFNKEGVNYQTSDLAKSDVYLNAEPLFATGQARILDHRHLANELRQLERRTGRGKDVIDHPPRGHDDHANAALGALVLAALRNFDIPLDGFAVGKLLETAAGALGTDSPLDAFDIDDLDESEFFILEGVKTWS